MEMMFAKPRQMYMVPRVAMKGATRSLAITAPFTQPIAQPSRMTMRMTIGTLKYSV